jgi:glycosyltransferase involved in cell wall biosynthesis
VLFEAYARLPHPRPALVCLGTPRADTPPIPPGVVVRHNVPHHEVMAAWHGAAAGIVPSVFEPMGQVAVEALLAGTPLIATAAGGLADMIRDGETGLQVPVGDPSSLAAAVHRVLTEPGLAAR